MTDPKDRPSDGQVDAAPERDDARFELEIADAEPKQSSVALELDPQKALAAGTDDEEGDERRGTIPDLASVRLDGAWRQEADQPRTERFGFSLALMLAVGLHGLVLALSVAAFSAIGDQIGGGGRDATSINVELVSVEALDELRAQRRARTQTAAAAARLAERTGGVRDTSESQAAADAAPAAAEPTERPVPSAAVVDEALPEPAPSELTVAPRQGTPQPNPARPEDAPSETTTTQPTAETEETTTPSEAPSRAVAAQAAQSAGGAPARQLSPPPVAADPPTAATTTTAAGREATGYARALFQALADLELHLQRSNDQRAERARGRVELELTIGTDGRPTDLRVVSSSGVAALDRVALADVRRFRFPPPPDGLQRRARTYRLPISYR